MLQKINGNSAWRLINAVGIGIGLLGDVVESTEGKEGFLFKVI